MREKTNNQFVIDLNDMEKHRVYPCDDCSFVSKTEAYIEVHRASKHRKQDLDTVQQFDNSPKVDDKDDNEHSDNEEDYDDDGPNECNHCFINGVKPGYVTDDWDDLLRHIWTDHKPNTVWGPSH